MDARVHFAKELRRLREAAGLTREQLGDKIGYTWETIRSIEKNRRTPKPLFAQKCDEALSVHGMLIELQSEAEDETSEFGSLMEVEHLASEIFIWDLRVIPGLLQTEAYASALIKDPALIRERMERQRILVRDEPPKLHVIISESCLYHLIGSPEITRAQLEYIVRSDAPWKLQVMPFAQGVHEGLSGPLTLLNMRDEPPVAFVDSLTGGSLVDDPPQISRLFECWQSLSADAMSPSMSVELIKAVFEDMPEERDDHWVA